MPKKIGGGPNAIHKKMAAVLKENPQGLTSGEWREKLGIDPGKQAHLDRRKRDLKKWYLIRKVRTGAVFRYFFDGDRDSPLPGRNVSQRIRAEILHVANGRCSMCGKTIDLHGITLVIDHKIPKDWGGSDEAENLWAICEDCNGGKKNFFGSQDQSLMRKIMAFPSIHVRIGETLKYFEGKPVPSYVIEFVAGQDEWRKRLRELRYLGWRIPATKKKNTSGRVKSFYTVKHHEPWPPDPSGWIQDYEKKRAARRKNERK